MYPDKIGKLCLLTWATLSIVITSVFAQSPSFDYTSHPVLDFSFNHLELELNVDPENQLLEGHAVYRVEANIGGVDSLILNAAHMDIRNVQVGGSEVAFRLANDSLFVSLGGTAEAGQQYSIEILYETSPQFGVHFGSEGTVWSSSLPLSNRHWLPVLDHPRVTFTTDITLVVPGSFSAVAPGNRSSEEITSVEEKQIRWQSERAIPANMLWFATGPFKTAQTSFGIKRIHVATGSRIKAETGDKLLQMTYNILQETEQQLGVEYPFETLNVIMLKDHLWETKQYGAGGIYLFRNRGNLEAQLRRGIYAQWFGVQQREEQWSDSEAINLYQTVLNQTLSPGTQSLFEDREHPDASVNPYHSFSARHWNRWQQFYLVWEDSAWKRTVVQSVNSELVKENGVKTWDDYAESWYASSGQPWFQPPQLTVEQETTQKDSIVYRVDYQYDEANSELVLKFEALDSVITELVSLPLIEFTGQQSDTMEVTFTGKNDSVMLTLDPLVSHVTIDSSVRDDLFLREYKPIPFILSQLRNAESASEKTEAARQLANHADNPDLQLAIKDLLSREQPAEVEAALLSSLGEITQGATGTEQQFLDALRSEQVAIKTAAAEALRHFRGNDQVVQALQRAIVQSDTMPLVKQATKSLLTTVDSADTSPLTSLSQQVVNQDTTGEKAVFVLHKLSQHQVDIQDLVKTLTMLTGARYSYTVRVKALNALKTADTEPKTWSSRVENLLRDNDPRIRLKAVRIIGDLEFLNSQEILREYLLDEYDGRVFYEMNKVTEK